MLAWPTAPCRRSATEVLGVSETATLWEKLCPSDFAPMAYNQLTSDDSKKASKTFAAALTTGDGLKPGVWLRAVLSAVNLLSRFVKTRQWPVHTDAWKEPAPCWWLAGVPYMASDRWWSEKGEKKETDVRDEGWLK